MFLMAVTALVAHSVEPVDTRTRVIDASFKSLQVRLAGNDLFPPILTCGNVDERIVVSFDELKDDRSYLRYTLVHCDADWQPS